jgi:hypothetical protein
MEEPHVAVDRGPHDVRVDLGEPFVEDPAAPGFVPSPLGPLLEAFAVGASVVTVTTDGRDEMVKHRGNGLLVEPGDPAGAAHLLDSLSRDRGLLKALREGAAETVAGWPTWDDAGAALRAELEVLVAAPPSFDERWPAQLMTEVLGEATKLSAWFGGEREALHEWGARLSQRDEELIQRENALANTPAGKLKARVQQLRS